MKNIILSVFIACSLFITGCFETSQEVSLNEDGSGIVMNTNDMSAMMGLAKQMAGKELDKIGEEKMDTSFSMASQADSIKGLTEEEKVLLKSGTLQINMNIKEDKFITTMSFPFTNPAQIPVLNKLSAKVMQDAIAQQMGENPAMGAMGEAPEISSFDDYYIVEFKNGQLTRTLNKEKYAKVGEDKYLNSMKEAASMGIPMTATYVINLPRPVKKFEGKGISVSDDKKKLKVKVDIDDFFDDASKLEYKIEY